MRMKMKRIPEKTRIGLISISDRASEGSYEDKGIPVLKKWLDSAIKSSFDVETKLIPDDRAQIKQALLEMVDKKRCSLVLTTGGTGPARRDTTPEATLDVATKEMPGFGEQMRQISLHFAPTAILSRQVAVIREIDDHAALILNLPGQPNAIRETLEGLRDTDGHLLVPGIFTAIPYCIDLIGGPYVETNDSVCKSWHPKSSVKKK